MRSSPARARVVRGTTAGAFALAAAIGAAAGTGALHPTTANAAAPNQLPYMCFNTSHTFHQIFGPNSFFLNENQQGPTSFAEGPPTSKPIATLPLHTGTAAGHRVYYVITDASDRSVATSLGVNFVPKLANAAGTSGVQLSSSNDPKAINVPAGVDFSPTHVLVAGPNGFPPAQAAAGAVGNPGYSPLVQLPSGVVLNAEQIGDGTTTNGADKAHWADKVETVDTVNHTVGYDITNGCYEDQSVHYMSFDSSFINGQTGRDNVQRQGENAAILDQESPLNILEDVPNNAGQFNYSPMWDIHFLQWDSSVPVSSRVRQTDFRRAEALVGTQAQSITPSGAASDTFQSTGFIVNCPLVSIFANN